MTLKDMIVDAMAEEDYRLIENADYWKDVHELLSDSIQAATKGVVRDILTVMLEQGFNFSAAYDYLKLPAAQKSSLRGKYGTGMGKLRRKIRTDVRFREYELSAYSSYWYRCVGLNSYREHGFTSAVERVKPYAGQTRRSGEGKWLGWPEEWRRFK